MDTTMYTSVEESKFIFFICIDEFLISFSLLIGVDVLIIIVNKAYYRWLNVAFSDPLVSLSAS